MSRQDGKVDKISSTRMLGLTLGRKGRRARLRKQSRWRGPRRRWRWLR